MNIVVVHLYPRELGINGDIGNVMALRKRAQWRGLPLEVIGWSLTGAGIGTGTSVTSLN